MKSLLKIYSRYIGVTWIIIGVLIMVNLGGLMIFGICHMAGNAFLFPKGIRGLDELISEGNPGEPFEVTEEIKEYLTEREFIFLMVLNDDGDVIGSWNKPEELKEHYTLGEVAGFTRWYLDDYPVKTLRTERGLFVAGREKDSAWKYSIEISRSMLDDALVYIQFFLALNLAVVLAVAFFLGYRYYKSLRPLSDGIGALSENKKIHLAEKGVASSLAAQINRTSDVLELQRSALEKRDTARTEWIAGVSHDIRTPLSMIMGYADELERSESLGEGERAKAAVIRSQSLKIRQLIEDLNLTSKLEYHMQPLRIRSFYPASLLRRLAAEVMNEEPGGQYELFPEIDGKLEGFAIEGDEGLMARAVRNLLNNSICHNPAGCRIFLSGRRTDDGYLVRVRDDGCGIPEEVVNYLTEEKGREDRDIFSGESFQGKKPHIMGLRIVKQIVLAHRGVFEIQEEGRCVSLWFPRNSGCI
ncbi:MAG: HAMP domain-containing histidine kinase [Clostridium sp.]|nr:HAMP domain-containing histidine kinase [Clostridium sp.]